MPKVRRIWKHEELKKGGSNIPVQTESGIYPGFDSLSFYSWIHNPTFFAGLFVVSDWLISFIFPGATPG